MMIRMASPLLYNRRILAGCSSFISEKKFISTAAFANQDDSSRRVRQYCRHRRHWASTTATTNQPQVTSAETKKYSLALSVYFCQSKELGMKDYEILSRATAFLVHVDPPRNERKRRKVEDVGWLEYLPAINRPRVHCLASSHVLAPWNWPKYYPQPWLKHVQQQDCKYSLEVYDLESQTSQASFELNPYAIHYPDYKMDLALIHLKNEEKALSQMASLGVEILHLRDAQKHVFEKDEEVAFHGFEVTDDVDAGAVVNNDESNATGVSNHQNNNNEDVRIFCPHFDTGRLSHASPQRFLAETNGSRPLPEGLCGGPVLSPVIADRSDNTAATKLQYQDDYRCCGIIEGIVPVDHENEKLRGAASFIPSPFIADFIRHAEEIMVHQVAPPEIVEKIVELKTLGADAQMVAKNTQASPTGPNAMDKEINEAVEKIKTVHGMENVDAILDSVQHESERVLEILKQEGGDLDQIIRRVRQETEAAKAAAQAAQDEKNDTNKDK